MFKELMKEILKEELTGRDVSNLDSPYIIGNIGK